jgi:hypothetical protein
LWGYSHIALLFYGLFAKTYFYHKTESFFFTYVSVFLRYQIITGNVRYSVYHISLSQSRSCYYK